MKLNSSVTMPDICDQDNDGQSAIKCSRLTTNHVTAYESVQTERRTKLKYSVKELYKYSIASNVISSHILSR